tara:strand:- start:36 stop:482 length:447 start_codon:yes stop_codon:yes gene_type:complete
MNENILDDQQISNRKSRRRDLLPVWIKVFIWIFLIFGAIVPVAIILGIIGINFNISLYGLETMKPISLIGMFIIFLFGLKGVIAFGLWTEKNWSVNLAIIDAIIGIIVCVFIISISFIENRTNISLRLELIPLILYLIKMRKIKVEWE